MLFRSATVGLVGLTLCLGVAPGPLAASKVAPSLPVNCTAQFKPAARLSNDAVCEAVRRALAASLLRAAHLTSVTAKRPNEQLQVVLRSPRRNAVEMSAKGWLRGRVAAFGPVTVDVMDRPLGQADVERLAVRMAESLAGR